MPDSREGQNVSPDRYHGELFCGDDGANWGSHWVAANGRSASDAAKFVESFVGPFEDGLEVELVFGHVEDHGAGGLRFLEGGNDEEDDAMEFWKVWSK